MECQEAFMQYKEAFYTRRLFGNPKKLSCNTKKPSWNTQELLRNTKKLYQIPWSFIEQHEALRNTKTELHVYQVKRSLEYQEALTKNSCNLVSRFYQKKHSKIHTNDGRVQKYAFLKDLGTIWETTSAPFSIQKLSCAAKNALKNRCPKNEEKSC